VYVPDIVVVALADTVGFGNEEIKPLGPVHAYVVIPAGPPVRVKGAPVQTGPLFDAVTNGPGSTITIAVPVIIFKHAGEV